MIHPDGICQIHWISLSKIIHYELLEKHKVMKAGKKYRTAVENIFTESSVICCICDQHSLSISESATK
jgi:hypothetical protein